MNDDALSNYGQRWQGIVFVVTAVSDKYMPSKDFFSRGRPSGYHPGYDESAGSALYDLAIEATGETFNSSLYDWELEPAPAGMKRKRTKGVVREDNDAEARGAAYARDQIDGEYFRQWVWEQMSEAEQTRKRDPNSVMPLESDADYRELARRMLQQLEWDTKRELPESRDFFIGFKETLQSPSVVNWLVDELKVMDEQLRPNRERKKSRSGAKRRKRS